MDDERDEKLVLSDTHPQLSYEHKESSSDKFSSGTTSASDFGTSFKGNRNVGQTGSLRSEKRTASIQMSGPLFVKSKPEEPYDPTPDFLREQKKLQLTDAYSTYDGVTKNRGMHNGTTPEKNECLLESGQLGMCNDPYCTRCPSYYNYKSAEGKPKNALYGDAKGWARSLWSFLQPYIPAGVMNPHPGFVRYWNKFFVISCLVAIFIDPLFFFVISVLEQAPDPTKESERYLCIRLDRPTATALVILRTITDVIYLFHILLQFWQAYALCRNGVLNLVDDQKKIACRYLTGFFLIDLFAVLPIPQVIILTLLSKALDTPGFARNLIRVAILVQYLPRLYRFLPLLAGQSPGGFIFESAWVNFVINLLTFILCGHVIGSCWYHFGSMRVYHCLHDTCHDSKIDSCMDFVYCGYDNNAQKYSSRRGWSDWIKYPNATACLDDNNNFQYGIYEKAVKLVAQRSFTTRYVYSLFWGLQQISTVAGNLTPSYFVWEVLFTMAIIGLALLLFALLIGNMQNFLQSLGHRRLEMTLRRRDVKQWMGHHRLPKKLRRKVLKAERNSWAAVRGVNEEKLMENLPEDLQIEIKRHIFNYVRKVPIFEVIDKQILDSIYEKLRLKTYIEGSEILYRGGFVDKMVFIVRGKLDSIWENGIIIHLSERDVCGEELLMWCLENSSDYRDGRRSRSMGQRCPCNRTVKCLTNVKAVILTAVDFQEVTSMHSRKLQDLRVQVALRYESPYWRCSAATTIQVAWRHHKNKKRTKLQRDQL